MLLVATGSRRDRVQTSLGTAMPSAVVPGAGRAGCAEPRTCDLRGLDDVRMAG